MYKELKAVLLIAGSVLLFLAVIFGSYIAFTEYENSSTSGIRTTINVEPLPDLLVTELEQCKSTKVNLQYTNSTKSKDREINLDKRNLNNCVLDINYK